MTARMRSHNSEPGLTSQEACARLAEYGPNVLPEARPPSFIGIFLKQFFNPLIYILLLAAVLSLIVSDLRDAVFIGIVLLINGMIGAVQEYSAGREAAALKKLEQPSAIVIRDGISRLIDACELVPGDVVLLEAGSRVPADLMLQECVDLQCDESLLTGESLPLKKTASASCFAGTMVTRGRGKGVVSATGLRTEIGKIAQEISRRPLSEPPLMIRMKRFTRNIAVGVSGAVVLLAVIGFLRGMDIHELFMMSVGLAVSAIPEGLPIAISIALAIAMRRMAKANVIVHHMPAVEALGSCTLIATDKTGTLTLNELTATDILLPDGTELICDTGIDITSGSIRGKNAITSERATRLLHAAALPNEAKLIQEENVWRGMGDTVDVALLAAAHKGGVRQQDIEAHYPLVSRIPYEPDLKYAASLHRRQESMHIFVKGAPEALMAMCEYMEMNGVSTPINTDMLTAQKEHLAESGLRVLAFAEGIIDKSDGALRHHHLVNLTFLGMVGMQDPIRPEVPQAIKACRSAGIEVVMVTGDDPKTASVIARQAGMEVEAGQIVTGMDIERTEIEGQDSVDRLTRQARVYARVKPAQKLAIVLSLARNGHFVAVTGDGVNDGPALKHAHVGVAMGRKGTDVAKESADIILTDDNFASIVAGIREGRVAYANIRKVVFMLASTGAAEVVVFLLAMLSGIPMPLLAVQLLWLNLVTNGIQDVALACEKAEGDELNHKPRNPREPIFDRVMTRRVLHATVVMGAGGFAVFWWLLSQGYAEAEARNLLLLLFVLFENVQTFNSRSERRSVFRQGFLANPFLVISVLAAQGLHIAAMHIPVLADTLGIAPVTWREWGCLLLAASFLMIVMEMEKWWDRSRRQA
ncbi:MAG: HAD-IC family P-type ATPase [Alphaproteobacteria bacterium]|nr:HAD-IC family P-type ATPase [Alphaproteobacteria bacterium]